MTEVAEQEYRHVPVADLRPYPGNPKAHDIEGIRQSMRANKFVGATVIQKSTGFTLSGHGTAEAAELEGIPAIPCIIADVDDAAARRLVLAYNRLPQKGGFVDDLLAEMLNNVLEDGELEGTGYSADDVDDYLAGLGALELPEQEFGGDYAEMPDAAAQRTAKPAVNNEVVGLREMVLVYKDHDYERLQRAITVIRNFHTTDTTSETVLAAITNYAEGLE